MSLRNLVIAAFISVLPAATAHAQLLPPEVRAAAARIEPEQIRRDLEFLAADALLGRATFTPGYDTAAHYIARRLAQAGLQPLGDSGTYFQYYDVVRKTADTAAYFVEIDGRRFQHGDVLLLPGEQTPTPITAELVYVGHGIRIPSLAIDPYAGLDVRGKIVIVQRGTLPANLTMSNLPADAEFPFRAARSQGAVAVLTMPSARLLQRWDDIRAQAGSYQDMVPNIQSAYSSGGAVIDILVRPPVEAALFAHEAFTLDSLKARAAAAHHVPGFVLRKSITIHLPMASEERRRGYNVLAKLEGSDAQLHHQYVTIAAHLDGAVGHEPAEDGDSIYNAADDNASGSAGILAVAEQLARAPRPRRSIVFIWDSGEEIGLYGTRSFVGKPVVPLKDIVAHFNVDMIGATRGPATPDSASPDAAAVHEVYVSGPTVLSASMDTLINRANRELVDMHLNYKYDTTASEFFYPRTDAGPFLERGVLSVDFFTGLHPRYHGPEDEAGYLDVGKITAVSKTVLGVVWAVANADAASVPRIDKPMPASIPRY